MKSIRFALIVSFALLVGVALSVVSLLVYKLTENTLHAEEKARREMLALRYGDLCKREEDKLDAWLGEQVRQVANQAVYRPQTFQLGGYYRLLCCFGSVGNATIPNGQVATPLWLLMTRGTRTYPSNYVPPNIQFPEEALLSLPEGYGEYIQINTSWQKVLRSESLGENEFPFDPSQFVQLYGLFYDDPLLEPGYRVRRAILKAPVSRFVSPSATGHGPWNPAGSWGGRGGSQNTPKQDAKRPGGAAAPPPNVELPPPPPRPTGPERPVEPRNLFVYFQYAADTRDRDEAIANLNDQFAADLRRSQEKALAALTSVRHWLLGVGLATFVLTVLGGFTLVHHRLSPLHRLSDAVSRVSEQDVRLQFDETNLPEELRPIVERLQQTLSMLRGALSREKQAAADISHELRTPLAAMLTTTEVALRKPRSSDEYREVLQDCRLSCQQMSRLVERLLTLSRLDVGVDRLRAQEVDAAELAEKCAGLVRPLAEARGLTMHFLRNGSALATLDADKLREILTNLLHNAIEYNVPSGSVEVAVERENGHLTLEVRDTGIGIAPEARKHIFERFYRADPSRQADSLHAGLGLAIVKGYLDLMGGTITVQSDPGQGSTFRVQLPVRPNTANGS